VSRCTDYAILAHNYYKGRNIIYLLTCHLFYYNAVSSPNYKVSDGSIITGNVEKQRRIENKMMHINRHTQRLDNTVNELGALEEIRTSVDMVAKGQWTMPYKKVDYHTTSKQSLTYLSHLSNTQVTR